MNKNPYKLRPYNPEVDHVSPPEVLADIPFSEGVPLDSPLNFEQRILFPSRFPVLEGKDESGHPLTLTHRMATAEVDIDGERVPIAYPSVVYENGELRELDSDSAFEHAMKTGEFRRFSSPEAAEVYSQGLYKRAWGMGEQAEAFMRQLRGRE